MMLLCILLFVQPPSQIHVGKYLFAYKAHCISSFSWIYYWKRYSSWRWLFILYNHDTPQVIVFIIQSGYTSCYHLCIIFGTQVYLILENYFHMHEVSLCAVEGISMSCIISLGTHVCVGLTLILHSGWWFIKLLFLDRKWWVES